VIYMVAVPLVLVGIVPLLGVWADRRGWTKTRGNTRVMVDLSARPAGAIHDRAVERPTAIAQ